VTRQTDAEGKNTINRDDAYYADRENTMDTRTGNPLFHMFDCTVYGVIFSLFLSAGYLKADPRLSWVPFDLTVLLAFATVCLCIVKFFERGIRINSALMWIIGLFLLMGVSILYTNWTSYAAEKAARFYTLTLLACIAPFILFQTVNDIMRYINAAACIALLLSIDAFFLFAQNVVQGIRSDRLAVAGDTIVLARSAGFAAIYFLFFVMERKGYSVLLSLLACVAQTLVLLADGQRGPVLALMLSMLLVFGIFYRSKANVIVRVAFAAAVIAACAMAGYNTLPDSSRYRIEMLFSEKIVTNNSENTSGMARFAAVDLSMEQIAISPLGLGWGGFDAIPRAETKGLKYPHNILAEILLETGWLPGVIFVAIIFKILVRLVFIGTHDGSPHARLLFAVFVYYFFNSCFSGDLNDNRDIFAWISLSSIFIVQMANGRLVYARDLVAGRAVYDHY
jgi:O-Antigen ligase